MADKATDQQVTQALKIGIAATQKGDHATALKVFKAVYDNVAIDAPPDGMSSFGLSLAVAENQTTRGVQLCREAIAAQFFEERHYENLARIHLHRKSRANAEQAIADGLKNVPNGTRLQKLQKELGIESAPLKPVSSDNGRGKLDVKALPPAVTILAGLLFFGLVFGVTFWVVYQQAYGP